MNTAITETAFLYMIMMLLKVKLTADNLFRKMGAVMKPLSVAIFCCMPNLRMINTDYLY